MLLFACCGVASAQGVVEERGTTPDEGVREAEALLALCDATREKDEGVRTAAWASVRRM